MNLSDLTPDEQLCLLGLVLQMMSADGVVSDDELLEMQALGAEMGMSAFNSALQAARRRFSTRQEAVLFAGGIERPEARELIHTVLVDMAVADGIAPTESELIRSVAQLWGIRSRHVADDQGDTI